MAAKKKTAKKLYVIGLDGSDYVYDNTYTSVKDAQDSAVSLVVDNGEDNLTIYELVPAKKIRVSVDIQEVK